MEVLEEFCTRLKVVRTITVGSNKTRVSKVYGTSSHLVWEALFNLWSTLVTLKSLTSYTSYNKISDNKLKI